MPIPLPVLRRAALVLALASTVAFVLVDAARPASADPGDDGTPNAMQAQLTAAAQGYVEAKGRLDASRARQIELTNGLRDAEQRLNQLADEVGVVAAAAYRGHRTSAVLAMLDSDSPAGFLHTAATMQYLTWRDDREIHDLLEARRQYSRQRDELTAEIAVAEQQLAEIAKRKLELEKALGHPSPAGGFSGGSPSATPAPRNPNGTWPRESCSQKDPTSTGCLTPRTLHALQEARAAGFTHYTHCFSPGSSGEHPLGRACDFAANPTGFVNARATGADKAYGDKLAAWLLANADRLGVLYIIWYKQFWSAASGWKTYTSGGGSIAGDHYNHVHMSIY